MAVRLFILAPFLPPLYNGSLPQVKASGRAILLALTVNCYNLALTVNCYNPVSSNKNRTRKAFVSWVLGGFEFGCPWCLGFLQMDAGSIPGLES